MIEVNGKDWIVMVNGLEADHLFNSDGEETFDVTEAVEYVIEGLAFGVIGQDTKIAIMSASHFYSKLEDE